MLFFLGLRIRIPEMMPYLVMDWFQSFKFIFLAVGFTQMKHGDVSFQRRCFPFLFPPNLSEKRCRPIRIWRRKKLAQFRVDV